MSSKTPKEALNYIIENAIDDLDIIFNEELQSSIKIIVKNLDILEDFIKLFEGENLDGWVEFDFNLARSPEDSIHNIYGDVTLLKRIKNYLEEVKNDNQRDS